MANRVQATAHLESVSDVDLIITSRRWVGDAVHVGSQRETLNVGDPGASVCAMSGPPSTRVQNCEYGSFVLSDVFVWSINDSPCDALPVA